MNKERKTTEELVNVLTEVLFYIGALEKRRFPEVDASLTAKSESAQQWAHYDDHLR